LCMGAHLHLLDFAAEWLVVPPVVLRVLLPHLQYPRVLLPRLR
jgi:hypothetical protein